MIHLIGRKNVMQQRRNLENVNEICIETHPILIRDKNIFMRKKIIGKFYIKPNNCIKKIRYAKYQGWKIIIPKCFGKQSDP